MNKITVENNRYTATDFRGEGEVNSVHNFPSHHPLYRRRELPPTLSQLSISPFHYQLYLFLREWFSEASTLRLHTSGSTGTPKEITVRKTQMLQSAKATCDFLGLKKNDKALLCLPLDFIAGKMMVVRALYAGMDLYPVQPDGHPLARTDTAFDFAAMVPLQVYNSLQSGVERDRLSRIKRLIIGGGAIGEPLEKELKAFPNAIYSTYGMTETLSHIALRRINGPGSSRYYTPLPTIGLALSADNTLIINAPLISDKPLITTDIAELRTDGTFRITGRKDNVINSGGIKVQIEEIEQVLAAHLTGNCAITSIPHPKLGEAIVLLIEPAVDPVSAETAVKRLLPRHQQPLLVHTVATVPQTKNGKTDRAATKQLAKKINLSSSTTRYIH